MIEETNQHHGLIYSIQRSKLQRPLTPTNANQRIIHRQLPRRPQRRHKLQQPNIHATPAHARHHPADNERIHIRRSTTYRAADLEREHARVHQPLDVVHVVQPADEHDARDGAHGEAQADPGEVLDVAEALVYGGLDVGGDGGVEALWGRGLVSCGEGGGGWKE